MKYNHLQIEVDYKNGIIIGLSCWEDERYEGLWKLQARRISSNVRDVPVWCPFPCLGSFNPRGSLESALLLHDWTWSAHVDQRPSPDMPRIGSEEAGLRLGSPVTAAPPLSTEAGRHLVQENSSPVVSPVLSPGNSLPSSPTQILTLTTAGPILSAIPAQKPCLISGTLVNSPMCCINLHCSEI